MHDTILHGMDVILEDLEEQYEKYKEMVLDKLGFKQDEPELPKPEKRYFR